MGSKKKRKSKNKKIDSNEIFQVIKKNSMQLKKFEKFVADNKELFLNATIETDKHTTPLSPLSFAVFKNNFEYTAMLIELGFPIEKQLLKEKGNEIIEKDDMLIHQLLYAENDKINQALLERFKQEPNKLIDGNLLLYWSINALNQTCILKLLENPKIDTFIKSQSTKIGETQHTPLTLTLFQITTYSYSPQHLQRTIFSASQQAFTQSSLQTVMQNEIKKKRVIEKKIREIRNIRNEPEISKEELQILLNAILTMGGNDALKTFEELTTGYSNKLSSFNFSINNQSPLHVAASLGHLGNCCQLISECLPIIYTLSDLTKETALQHACQHPNVIRIIINRHQSYCDQKDKPLGFIPNYLDYTSLSALPTALLLATTVKNNVESIKLLVEAGASLELGDHKNQTPLQIALTTRSFEYVPLLATEATVNLMSQTGSPLHRLFKNKPFDTNSLDILAILLHKGADPTLSCCSTNIKYAYFEKKPEGIVMEHLRKAEMKYNVPTEKTGEQNLFQLLEEEGIANKTDTNRHNDPEEIKLEQKKEAEENKEMLENAFTKILYPIKNTHDLNTIIRFHATTYSAPLFQAIVLNLTDAIKFFHPYKIDLDFRFALTNQNKIGDIGPFPEKTKDLLSITSLLLSIIHRHDELTEFLINSGCDLKLGFLNSDLTPFLTAIVAGSSERIIKFLCEKSDPEQQQIEKAICLAAYMNNVVIVKFLLETAKKKNYSLNLNVTENTHGLTALSCAAFQNSTECVRLLLKNHASPNVPIGPRQETPLFQAVKNNNPEMIADLIRSGANVNFYNLNGLTPLHYAIIFGNLKTLKELLPHCSIDLSTKFENSLDGIRDFSPLQFAIFLGRTRIALALIKNGADVNYQTSTGETAFDLTNKYRIGYAVTEKLKRKHDQPQTSEKDEIKTEDNHAHGTKFSDNNLSSPPQEKITGRKFLTEMGFSKSEIEELQKSFEEEDEIKTEDEDKSVEKNKTSWEYMGRLLTPESEGVVPIARSDHFRYFFIDKTRIEKQKCPPKLIEKFFNLRAKSADKQGADGYCHFTNQNRPKDIHSGFFIKHKGKDKELPIDGELKIFSKKGKGASRLFCISIPPKEKGSAPLITAVKYLSKGLH